MSSGRRRWRDRSGGVADRPGTDADGAGDWHGRRTMFARLTALLGALLLASATLAACTGGGEEAGPGEATATPAVVRTPPPIPTATPTRIPPPEPPEVAADRAVLVALYHATGGEDWFTSTNWLTDKPLGHWYGVTTDIDGRVTVLQLKAGLTGRLPPELGSLTRLQRLILEQYRFPGLSGPIPPELGMLTRLKELVLAYNELSGAIPAELGGLTNLEVLWLGNNQLSGPIPAELGGLTNLEALNLDQNQLSGPIPAELARIHRSKLDGAGCRAGGEFGGCGGRSPGGAGGGPERGAVAQRGSGALRARARGCARRARACWREPRSRARTVSGRQAGSGSARNRASAAAHWPAQGQRFGRCRVQRRAEWVSRPARAK